MAFSSPSDFRGSGSFLRLSGSSQEIITFNSIKRFSQSEEPLLRTSDDPLSGLESNVFGRPEPIPPSVTNKRLFWLKMWVSIGTLFVAEAARGLVIPTLFLYVASLGGDDRLLGITVAAFSVGRLIGGVLFGWWFNRFGGKQAFAVCVLISLLGNLLYTVGPLTNIWVLITSRFMTGFSTGIISTVRAVIAEMTTTEQRTKYIALSSAMQYVGFAITPGAAAALVYIHFHIGPLPVNQFTSAGYILAIVNAIMLAVIIIFYPSERSAEEKDMKQAIAAIPKNDDVSAPFEHDRTLFIVGSAVFIMLNLVARGALSLLETVGSPIFMIAWNEAVPSFHLDAVSVTAYMTLGLGVLGLLMFLSIDPLRRYITEDIMLVSSFILIGGGAIILISFGAKVNLARFLVGATLIWSLGSPISQTLVISSFSKMLGGRPQGTMMGWITSAGSLGRIVFPFLSGFAGDDISFILSAIICFVASAAIVVYTLWMRRKHNL